jgi:hypothetical protein
VIEVIFRLLRMSEDERRSHNMKRRQKQVAIKTEETGKETPLDDDSLRRIREQNVKKAEAARQRYHRMVWTVSSGFLECPIYLLFCYSLVDGGKENVQPAKNRGFPPPANGGLIFHSQQNRTGNKP